ncbi:hypothetical protein BC830DRAFT_146402 [Chytriomyces sp. MP71]|nr:hypothetical protein BC830DRAFT_146402 [Chytriomyces sp. MP71]
MKCRPKMTPTFHTIPTEIKQQIFSYLSIWQATSIANACRVFAAVLLHDSGFVHRQVSLNWRTLLREIEGSHRSEFMKLPVLYRVSIVALLMRDGKARELTSLWTTNEHRALWLVQALSSHRELYGADLSDPMLLLWSCECGFAEVAKYLIERHQSNTRYEQSLCIRLAASAGHLDIVHFLAPLSDISACENSCLISSCIHGHVHIVRFLLDECNVDPSIPNNLAARQAASRGYVDILRLLAADPRTDLSHDDNVCLMRSVSSGHIEVVQFLLSVLDMNANFLLKAYYRAIQGGFSDILRLLLATDNANMQNHAGDFIVMATSHAQASILHALLESASNMNLYVPDLTSLLSKLLYGSHFDVILVMLQFARVTKLCPSWNDNHILRSSCNAKRSHDEIVKLCLLDDHVSLPSECLLDASLRGHKQTVLLLLQDWRASQMDVSIQNNAVIKWVCSQPWDGTIEHIALLLFSHPKLDLSKSGTLCFKRAQLKGNKALVDLFLVHGPAKGLLL